VAKTPFKIIFIVIHGNNARTKEGLYKKIDSDFLHCSSVYLYLYTLPMQLLKDIDLAACISLHMQKSPKKKSLGVYFQYRINKNALLQTVLLAILPTEYFYSD